MLVEKRRTVAGLGEHIDHVFPGAFELVLCGDRQAEQGRGELRTVLMPGGVDLRQSGRNPLTVLHLSHADRGDEVFEKAVGCCVRDRQGLGGSLKQIGTVLLREVLSQG